MKKLINDPVHVVREMIEGLAIAHPGLALLEGETVLVRRDAAAWRAAGNVALVAGGGAGHEPAHAGYVGAGMLTGAVSGDVCMRTFRTMRSSGIGRLVEPEPLLHRVCQ